MTLTEHVLRGSVLKAGAVNRLPIGLPWFRSMPFSSITGLELHVQDEPVRDVRLEADGRPVTTGTDAAAAYWFLQDRCTLVWSGPVPAEHAEVVLRMRLQLPNLTLPDGGLAVVLQEVRGGVQVAAS